VSARSRRPGSLVRNTIAQTTGSLSAYIFSFVSAPIILAGLGLRSFGIWALTGALAQYGALLDLGVGVSLARFVAAHQEDRRVCGRYMAIGWMAVGIIALILAPIAALGAAPLAHAIHGISVGHMHIVLFSSFVLLMSSMVTGVIIAFPIGHRRMVAPNVAAAIAGAINFGASVGSIALGAKLPGYALANAGAGLASVLVVATVVVSTEGRLPLARPEWGRVREFLAFSVKQQLVRIANLVNYQTDKIVIAFSVGPAAAGAYELANRVALAVRQVGIYVTSATDIELTTLVSKLGVEGVRPRYERLTQVTATMAFPPVLLGMATAPLLLSAWLHHAPPDSVAVLVALSAAYLLAVSTGVGSGMTVATGQPGVIAKVAVSAAIANVILTASLAPLFGIWGVLSGTVVALSSGSAVQMVFVHRRFSWPVRAYFRAIAPPLGVYTLLAGPVAAVSYAHLVHGRAAEAVLFVMLATAYLTACGAWALRAGRLPATLAQRLRLVRRRSPSAVAEVAVEPRGHARDHAAERVTNV
jgi:O-antigen/teichoic acid export membrane protein